jgi:hypothetical protein
MLFGRLDGPRVLACPQLWWMVRECQCGSEATGNGLLEPSGTQSPDPLTVFVLRVLLLIL